MAALDQLTMDEFCCQLSFIDEVCYTLVSLSLDIAAGSGLSGEDSRREAAASMLLFGLTQRYKKPFARARHSTPRDTSLRSERTSIWWNGICCKRSGSTSHLGAHGQHLLSRYMKIRSAPRSGPRVLERSRTAVSSPAMLLTDEGWKPRRTSDIDKHQACNKKSKALTRQQQRRRCVNGFFVRYGGLEDDAMSQQVIFCVVSCAPSCSSDAFPDHVTSPRILSRHLVSCKILLVVVVTRFRSTMEVDKRLWR